jgi:hypothetical protein
VISSWIERGGLRGNNRWGARRLLKLFSRKNAIVLAMGMGVLLLEGYFQLAAAQCAVDNKTVFIDPRLIPPRTTWTPDAIAKALASPELSPEERRHGREMIMSQYMHQFEPTVIPYRGGSVYISPTDPCLQQFIPQ